MLSSCAIETLTQKDIPNNLYIPSHKNIPFTKDVRKSIRNCIETMCKAAIRACADKSDVYTEPSTLSDTSRWKETYNVYLRKDLKSHVMIGHDGKGNEYVCTLQATFTVIPGTSYSRDVSDNNEMFVMINPSEFQKRLDKMDIIHESYADNIRNAPYTNSIITKILDILCVRGVLPWHIVPRNAYSCLVRNRHDLSYSLVEWNEKMDGKVIDIARQGWFESDQPRITSMLIQILVPILAVFARGATLYHGNLTIENVVYKKTDKEFISVCVGDNVFNVPTHGLEYRVIGWENGYMSCNHSENCVEFFTYGFQKKDAASWKDATSLVYSVYQFTSEKEYPLFKDWLHPDVKGHGTDTTHVENLGIHSAVTFLAEHCL